MNKFWELFRNLFGLSDEQVEKAQEELSKIENNEEDKPEDKGPDSEKEEDKAEDIADGVGTQPAGVSGDSKGDVEMVAKEEYKKLQDELAAVKGLLEQQNAERVAEKRKSKIDSYKDCLDTSYLSTLLDGVDEKDFDKKVEEIKKEKAYLFSKPETDGFNPAEPNTKMNGVEAAFYKNNPDLLSSRV